MSCWQYIQKICFAYDTILFRVSNVTKFFFVYFTVYLYLFFSIIFVLFFIHFFSSAKREIGVSHTRYLIYGKPESRGHSRERTVKIRGRERQNYP